MQSIKVKTILSFSIAILLICGILGYASYQNARVIIQSEAEDALVSLAKEGIKLIESRLETNMVILESIAARSTVQSMNWRVQSELLSDVLAETGRFLTLAVVEPGGRPTILTERLLSSGIVTMCRRRFKEPLMSRMSLSAV